MEFENGRSRRKRSVVSNSEISQKVINNPFLSSDVVLLNNQYLIF